MPPPYINWLASYPKSGNTWVRAFLEYYETGKLDINKMDVVIGDERNYFYQAVTAQPIDMFDLYHWALIRPAALYMYLYMNQDRDRLILKTHNAFAVIGEIPVFPPLLSGPSVYLVRDPVDVIPSFARHTGNSIEDMIEGLADSRHAFEGKLEKRSMIGFLSSWENHVTTWSNAPDTLTVRYEDLKSNPEYWFKQILQQFGYEVNKDKLVEAIEASALDNLKRQESDSGFKETGKNDIFFGGTTEKLTSEQIETVVEAFGPTMNKFGYLTEDLKYGSHH